MFSLKSVQFQTAQVFFGLGDFGGSILVMNLLLTFPRKEVNNENKNCLL